MFGERFFRNLLIAFGAQTISLLSSIVASVFVPKVLGVSDYAVWQLFLFYCTYAGVFHFGLTDGTYLRLGGRTYQQLNYSSLKTQMVIMLGIHTVIGLIVITFSVSTLNAHQILMVSLTIFYIIIYNIHNYLGYIHQAVNQTTIYSGSIVVEKIIFLLTVTSILLLGINNAFPLIVLYIIAKVIACIYTVGRSKEIISAAIKFDRNIFLEIISSIQIGISMMLSNFASMLVLGIGKQLVEIQWGLEIFGKYTFSITMSNLFMQFISQVGMVLFPVLRRFDQTLLKRVFQQIREICSLLLPLVLVLYIPTKVFIQWWLPAYYDSAVFMGYLLPLCIYDGKMSLLYVTQFKVLRREKMMLRINLTTLLISSVISITSVFVLESVRALALGMVFSVAFRSVLSEIMIGRLMGDKASKSIIGENILVILYLLYISIFSDELAFAFILATYVLYGYIKKRNIVNIEKT